MTTKVTIIPDLPDIAPYVDGDEDVFYVATYEKAKEHIIEVLQNYIEYIQTVHYKDWKKNGSFTRPF